MKQSEMKSTIAEVVAILEPLSNEDKKQALALLQGMIIGKGGQSLKKVGTQARIEMEDFFF